GCASSRRRASATWRPLWSGPKAPSSSSSSARWRTCGRAWVAMAERTLVDRLDEIVDVIIERGDATAALRDPELAPLARVAADLRHYPNPEFKARLRIQLERRTTMTAATMAPAVREGFTTVTPYIRVPDAGLFEFLTKVFDAEETFSGHGGG